MHFSRRTIIVAFLLFVFTFAFSLATTVSAFAEVQQDKEPGTNPATLAMGIESASLSTEADADADAEADSATSSSTRSKLAEGVNLAVESTSVWGIEFGDGMTAGQVAHGLDISVWDGPSNDFARARNAGLEFAIIRCGYGNDETYQDDEYWITNVRQAVENGVPFGVYIYSYATNTAMAASEGRHVLRQLDNAARVLGINACDITYPVYFDFEDDDQAGLGRDQVRAIVDTFATTIKSSPTWGSVDVGYYSMRSWTEDDNKLNTIKTFSCNGQTYQYSRWVAEWGRNEAGCLHVLHNNAYEEIAPTWYDIWQVCSEGKVVDGIRNNSSHIDVDFAYKTFGADLSGTCTSISVDTPQLAYTGQPLKPSVTVKYGRSNPIVLREGVDYKLSCYDNTAPGTASVVITGTGRYKGSVVRNFTISGKPISSCVVSRPASVIYNGKAQRPAVKVYYKGRLLKEGRDYILSYSNNKNIGTASILVQGKGQFGGKGKVTFKINPKPMSHCVIYKPASRKYTGRAICPTVTVRYDGKTLVKGRDYTVSYKNNVKVGTAFIIIKGKGVYAGTRTVTFKIKR